MNIFINNNEQRPRAGWRLLIQFIFMFLFVGFGIMGVQQLLADPLIIYTTIPQFLGIILSVWLAAKLLDKRSFFEYGINFNKQWSKDFFTGCLIAAISISTIFLIQWSLGWITIIEYGWEADLETPFLTGIISFFVAMLMVGFHEELLSRGYQLLNITEGLKYPAVGLNGALVMAILLTSSLFGFMHFFNPNASFISTFNIILAGIVLAIPYVLTGSLGLSVGLHFSWNFVMAGILGFPVSGKNIEFSILQIQQSGADFFTGGAFGPEAGILGLLGMTIMLGGSLVYIRQSRRELNIDQLFKKDYQQTTKSDEQTA
ncbi:type II CAAX endopeptidase family protein [Fodinibius sp.]|uniref:CPBP family intramembrane glutamic endopeptidase n=1 Tax=Fodinibius sp. TaxID=1872440 RepID=UPI002ACED2FA|nr:type II CAAX endopeptidase family protein [Fodinibius sp.]MDZ7660429.1 type II CAAX endopeptidase family protein [Fodinibius sp.]